MGEGTSERMTKIAETKNMTPIKLIGSGMDGRAQYDKTHENSTE
jgi:hypothetical protein